MRSTTVPAATLVLALVACDAGGAPTEPDAWSPATEVGSLTTAPNTWITRAPPPLFDQFIFGYDLGAAPDASGQSIVYTFGGSSSDEGGAGKVVQAYDVATNSWTVKASHVGVFSSNGVGRIGRRIYISGGYNEPGSPPTFTNQVWAYDYAGDRMLRKADLPLYSAEGVTGVIDGKLYVLPGACSGERYPDPGYCAEEPTRRFYRYDPGTNTWVSRRSAPHYHRAGAAAVIAGKLYVAGGFNGFQPVASLDVYDPSTNSWTTLPSLPAAGAASGAALKGKFYVLVATSSGNRAYAYNPATKSWSAKAAPAAFGSATRVTLDGRSYLFTATGNQSALYTP